MKVKVQIDYSLLQTLQRALRAQINQCQAALDALDTWEVLPDDSGTDSQGTSPVPQTYPCD